MAIYARDYYGRSKYGATQQQIALLVDPFEAQVIGFNTVALSWAEPGGTWSGFRILRSASGYPISETDGEIVFDIPVGYSGATGKSFVDTSRAGGWHYYAIFLWDSGAQIWERAAVVDVLIPYDFGSGDAMWDSIPEYYKQIFDDHAGYNQQKYRINPAIYMNNQDAAPNLHLAKFLQVFGWTFDLLRSQADLIMDGYDISSVHVNRLALLAQQFGAELEGSASASANRSLVRNLGALYRKRGTLDGIRETVALVTGWDVDVVLGPNLMLSEDQANFINPEPQWWDATVRYVTGDRVRSGLYLYQAKTTAYGVAQMPPGTKTSNTWWDADVFIEPLADYTVARTDTGNISTWQIEGPTGFVDGGTFIGAGTVDPEDGTINYSNALAFRNTSATDNATFTLRSIPRLKTNLTSWDKQLVIESGVPVPRPRYQWVSGTRYRAGDMVLYYGSPYEALSTTDTAPPTDTTTWKRLGYDDRVRLCLSWWAKGPHNGTVNTGGKREHAVVTEFDENGDMLYDTVCAPTTYATKFYDAFNDVSTLTSGRVPAMGSAWSANGVGTWGINRDLVGGYAYPPTTGRSYQLAPATVADGNVAVTYRAVPAGSRLLGLIFRWVDANNFWVATQTGVYKVVAGAAPANPASGALTYTAFQAGERLRVELNGSTIKVYRNSTLLGTATDAFNSTANRHGVEVEA